LNLQFNGSEVIPRSKDDVWRFVNDPSSVAPCLPDVQSFEVKDAHKFDAVVQVAVGPVRGKLKFTVTIDPQADGEHMNLRISANGLGSVVDVNASALITGEGNSTTLDWNASASMRGPVATIGARVAEAQAQRIITQTFANVKSRLTAASVT
jgi:carbon monoxide dehydrogenase subunit G